MPNAVVITVSDSACRGEREDLSGPTAREILEKLGYEVLRVQIVPDEIDQIRNCLIHFSDNEPVELIVTAGGTGLGPRDVTPEATAAIVDREVPGLAEMIRWEGSKQTVRAMLSRSKAGIRKRTLIVNLPGSVKGVAESLNAITPVLSHALEVIAAATAKCGG